MNRNARILAILLLALLGLSAIGGGCLLISDPKGELIKMPLELLEPTPFSSYLLPGVILFLFLGFNSIIALIMVAFRMNDYPYAVIFQGIVLFVWLIIELLMNPQFYVPLMHIPLFAISGLLVLLGVFLKRESHCI